ncbi:hypothetical protein DSECCO2_562610 [anaerobic digester metagenome]
MVGIGSGGDDPLLAGKAGDEVVDEPAAVALLHRDEDRNGRSDPAELGGQLVVGDRLIPAPEVQQDGRALLRAVLRAAVVGREDEELVAGAERGPEVGEDRRDIRLRRGVLDVRVAVAVQVGIGRDQRPIVPALVECRVGAVGHQDNDVVIRIAVVADEGRVHERDVAVVALPVVVRVRAPADQDGVAVTGVGVRGEGAPYCTGCRPTHRGSARGAGAGKHGPRGELLGGTERLLHVDVAAHGDMDIPAGMGPARHRSVVDEEEPALVFGQNDVAVPGLDRGAGRDRFGADVDPALLGRTVQHPGDDQARGIVPGKVRTGARGRRDEAEAEDGEEEPGAPGVRRRPSRFPAPAGSCSPR